MTAAPKQKPKGCALPLVTCYAAASRPAAGGRDSAARTPGIRSAHSDHDIESPFLTTPPSSTCLPLHNSPRLLRLVVVVGSGSAAAAGRAQAGGCAAACAAACRCRSCCASWCRV